MGRAGDVRGMTRRVCCQSAMRHAPRRNGLRPVVVTLAGLERLSRPVVAPVAVDRRLDRLATALGLAPI
jgi:hypothetical protein